MAKMAYCNRVTNSNTDFYVYFYRCQVNCITSYFENSSTSRSATDNSRYPSVMPREHGRMSYVYLQYPLNPI